MKIFLCLISLSLLFAFHSYGNFLVDPNQFDIVIKCHFKDGKPLLSVIRNKHNISNKEIKETIPIKHNNSSWYVLRHEIRNDNNEVIVSYNKMIEAKETVCYSVILPGHWMLSYSIKLEEFDRYLRGETEWSWKPQLINTEATKN
jgi:hypothetical protein